MNLIKNTYDEDDETPFIPERTCFNWLKDLCKTISEELSDAKTNE